MRVVSGVVAMLIGVCGLAAAAGQTIAPTCARAGGTMPDTISRAPDLKVLVVPPALPDKYRDSVVVVRIRSDRNGHADSVSVTGISDVRYIGLVRAAFIQAAFRPALDHGCPSIGWYTLTVTSPNGKRGRP